MRTIKFLLVILLSPGFFQAKADVKLPRVISENMIFQRNQEIKIWGWADRGERISVEFNSVTLKTRASKDGKWSVTFPAMKAGGPYELKISAKNEIHFRNILIGDVWICSGQSNMQWTVENSGNAEKEIASADYPGIRLITIPRVLQYNPVDDVSKTNWVICSPESAGNFSAVAYFFG